MRKHAILISCLFLIFCSFSGCFENETFVFEVRIVEPNEGETIHDGQEKLINITLESTVPNSIPTRTEFYLDGEMIDYVTIDMNRVLSTGHLSTADHENGIHNISVIAYWDGTQEIGWKSNIKDSDEISVFFDN